MEKNEKKGYVIYTLSICYNKDTEDIEFIAEGIDETKMSITPLNPFNLDKDITKFFTSEDMEAIRELYDIEEI